MTFQTLKYVKYIFILLKFFLLLQTQYMKHTASLPAFLTCPCVRATRDKSRETKTGRCRTSL